LVAEELVVLEWEEAEALVDIELVCQKAQVDHLQVQNQH
jgi:hypothetical protein